MNGTTGAPGLTGRSIWLRPILPADYEACYRWATEPPTSDTWRYRGFTPSPDSFPALLWNGVITQYAICRRGTSAPIGLVQAFDHDTANRVAYLGILLGPDAHQTGAAAEALALFLNHLFAHVDLRKVYAETSESAVQGLARIVREWEVVREEGRLTRHLFYEGDFHDLVVLAMHREDFEASRERILRLIGSPSATASRPLSSFHEFVDALPSDLLPGLEDVRDPAGGTLLVDDLGLDSLGYTELICCLEDAHDVDLDRDPPFRTLQDLYGAIEIALNRMT